MDPDNLPAHTVTRSLHFSDTSLDIKTSYSPPPNTQSQSHYNSYSSSQSQSNPYSNLSSNSQPTNASPFHWTFHLTKMPPTDPRHLTLLRSLILGLVGIIDTLSSQKQALFDVLRRKDAVLMDLREAYGDSRYAPKRYKNVFFKRFVGTAWEEHWKEERKGGGGGKECGGGERGLENESGRRRGDRGLDGGGERGGAKNKEDIAKIVDRAISSSQQLWGFHATGDQWTGSLSIEKKLQYQQQQYNETRPGSGSTTVGGVGGAAASGSFAEESFFDSFESPFISFTSIASKGGKDISAGNNEREVGGEEDDGGYVDVSNVLAGLDQNSSFSEKFDNSDNIDNTETQTVGGADNDEEDESEDDENKKDTGKNNTPNLGLAKDKGHISGSDTEDSDSGDNDDDNPVTIKTETYQSIKQEEEPEDEKEKEAELELERVKEEEQEGEGYRLPYLGSELNLAALASSSIKRCTDSYGTFPQAVETTTDTNTNLNSFNIPTNNSSTYYYSSNYNSDSVVEDNFDNNFEEDHESILFPRFSSQGFYSDHAWASNSFGYSDDIEPKDDNGDQNELNDSPPAYLIKEEEKAEGQGQEQEEKEEIVTATDNFTSVYSNNINANTQAGQQRPLPRRSNTTQTNKLSRLGILSVGKKTNKGMSFRARSEPPSSLQSSQGLGGLQGSKTKGHIILEPERNTSQTTQTTQFSQPNKPNQTGQTSQSTNPSSSYLSRSRSRKRAPDLQKLERLDESAVDQEFGKKLENERKRKRARIRTGNLM